MVDRLQPRLHYAWVVAGMTFLILLASAGVRSMTGVLIVPLESDLGWDRATISFAVSLNILLFGLSGPFAAAVMDTFGMRRVLVSALSVLTVVIGLSTQMREPWQLIVLWGVFAGLATGSMAGALGAMVANRWFAERRGLVMGLLTASNATGQLVFLPLLASLVVNLNWRAASATVAGVTLLLIVPVAVFMRGRPREVGLRPFGRSLRTMRHRVRQQGAPLHPMPPATRSSWRSGCWSCPPARAISGTWPRASRSVAPAPTA